MCMQVCLCASSHAGQKMSNPLELELYSWFMWVLRTKLGSSARAGSSLFFLKYGFTYFYHGDFSDCSSPSPFFGAQ